MVKLDAALEAFIAGESVEYAWESQDKETGAWYTRCRRSIHNSYL